MTGRIDVILGLDDFYADVPSHSGIVTIGEINGVPRYNAIERCHLHFDIWKAIRKSAETRFRSIPRNKGKSFEGARFAADRNLLGYKLSQELLLLSWAVESGGDIEPPSCCGI